MSKTNPVKKPAKKRTTLPAKYPEHERMKAVQTESHTIGEFIEWLEFNGIWLAEFPEGWQQLRG